MPSTSSSSTESPITRLPYDILLEIFIHCLPPQPQYSFQGLPLPDPEIAPILLCHICSSWRDIALTAPILWMCLSYCFTIVMGDDYDVYSTSGGFSFLAREIEFVRWWRANQGQVAPSLNFSVYECDDSDLEPWEEADNTTSDGMDFLLEAIFAAQFLDVHELFWRRIEDMIREGHSVVFPNLHALLMKQVFNNNESFHAVLRLLPENGLPALRRVSIMACGHDRQIARRESVHVLQRWSTAITHIILQAPITPDFWYDCLDAFPNLRWGFFTISWLPGLRDAKAYREPGCTLLQLATLRVRVDNIKEPNKLISALTLLFGNLHLPALRTLSLSSNRWSRTEDRLVLNDLDNVLRSTPALTTLRLEDNFLPLSFDRTAAILSAPRGDALPIWHRAPQLANVQLYVAFYGNDEMPMDNAVDLCVCCIVGAEGGWLDLRNSACPIQSLTIMGITECQQGFRDLIVARVRESAENARKVFIQTHDGWSNLEFAAQCG